jgi:hypothetical protein
MLTFLIVCSVLAGIAAGLAFRAKAIVIVAPVMAAVTMAVLLGSRVDFLTSLGWLCICLAAGQAAFLMTSALDWSLAQRFRRTLDSSSTSAEREGARDPEHTRKLR